MKIAVLSDIHANLVALKAAVDHIDIWRPDFVVVCGDIVNRGPRPLECFEYLQQRKETDNWLLLRGNHENYVIHQKLSSAPKDGAAYEVHRASIWTYNKIKDTAPLEALPFKQSIIDPNGRELRFLHASMQGMRVGVYPETSDLHLRQMLFINNNSKSENPPIIYCVGHTHRTLIRNLSGRKIVNVGSVGLPFDKDPRLAYAQFTFKENHWSEKIIRLKYDLDSAEKDFFTTGYFDEAGALIRLVLKELKESSSHLYNWSASYQNYVLNGDLTMEASVENYILSL